MKRSKSSSAVIQKPVDHNKEKQSNKHTLVDSTKQILETGDLADLEFLVGNDQEVIHAHKFFLVMRSPVFKTMFCGSVPQPQPVAIPDIEPVTFKNLLQYIYTDIVKLKSVEEAYGLYRAAVKYMIPSNLLEHCIQYVMDHLTPNNVFRALEFGIFHGNKALKAKCFTFFSHQLQASYKADTAGFQELEESTLLTILKLEVLDMSEQELFDALKGWASRRCAKKNVEITGPNLRKELKKEIIHIRFLAMTAKEFSSSQDCENRVLTDAECMAVLMILNGRDKFPMPSSLSTNRRTRECSMDWSLREGPGLWSGCNYRFEEPTDDSLD